MCNEALLSIWSLTLALATFEVPVVVATLLVPRSHELATLAAIDEAIRVVPEYQHGSLLVRPTDCSDLVTNLFMGLFMGLMGQVYEKTIRIIPRHREALHH